MCLIFIFFKNIPIVMQIANTKCPHIKSLKAINSSSRLEPKPDGCSDEEETRAIRGD
jgi:hypothetical protein